MILYYTHNKKDPTFTRKIYDAHRQQAHRMCQRFVAVVAQRIGDGDMVIPERKGPAYSDLFFRILIGLELCQPDEMVYLAEDDCLYPDVRFGMRHHRLDALIYNMRIAYINECGYFWAHHGAIALGQAFGPAAALRNNILAKLFECMHDQMSCIEPAEGEGRPYITDTMPCGIASVDFRGVGNSTWTTAPEGTSYFKELYGWPNADKLWNKTTKQEIKQ